MNLFFVSCKLGVLHLFRLKKSLQVRVRKLTVLTKNEQTLCIKAIYVTYRTCQLILLCIKFIIKNEVDFTQKFKIE